MEMTLSSIFNTKWLTDDYVEDINYMRECVLENKKVNPNMWQRSLYEAIMYFREKGHMDLDFAGVQISTKVWERLDLLVHSYKGKVTLLDSADEHRGKFLAEYMDSVLMEAPKYEELPPKPASIKQLPAWVKSLRVDCIYNGIYYDSHPEFIAIIQLMRPEVKLRCMNKSLFKYLNEKFKMSIAKEETEFRYVMYKSDTFYETEADEDGNVYVLNVGTMSLDDFTSNYCCIPKWIGEQPYNKYRATPYQVDAVKEISEDVQVFLAERPLTIKTIFEED